MIFVKTFHCEDRENHEPVEREECLHCWGMDLEILRSGLEETIIRLDANRKKSEKELVDEKLARERAENDWDNKLQAKEDECASLHGTVNSLSRMVGNLEESLARERQRCRNLSDSEAIEAERRIAAQDEILRVWNLAIDEAEKEREVFVTRDDILSMERDLKIRAQMRKEISDALQKLKPETKRVSLPCPDGTPGCLVFHFKWVLA